MRSTAALPAHLPYVLLTRSAVAPPVCRTIYLIIIIIIIILESSSGTALWLMAYYFAVPWQWQRSTAFTLCRMLNAG